MEDKRTTLYQSLQDGATKNNNVHKVNENNTRTTTCPCDQTEDNKSTGSCKSEKFSLSSLPSRGRWIFALAAVSDFFISSCSSLLPPFFPTEATIKGTPPVLIGAIFSCFEFWMFTSAPFYGNFLTAIGAKFMWVSGLFTCGSCSILFGVLDKSPPGAPFTGLCLAVRTVEALGACAFMTASFSVIANEFPNNVATVFGVLESFTALGYMLGPMIGGLLYEVGGFALPFWLLGFVLVGGAALTFLFLPAVSDDVVHQEGTILTLLRSPLAIVSCVSAMLASSCFGVINATLALQLDQFGITPVVKSSSFLLLAFGYCVSVPAVGRLCDRKNIAIHLMITGSVVCGVTLLLYGPAPFLPFVKRSVWQVTVSLVGLSLGVGTVVISSLHCLLTGARRLGFQDGLQLFAIVSGSFNFVFRIGMFSGPLVASALYQAVGMEWCSTVSAGFLFLSALVVTIYMLVDRRHAKHPSDRLDPLQSRD